MTWVSLRVTPDSNRDGVIAALFEAGSQGIHEDGRAVVTHFPADACLDDIRSAVMSADPRADIAIATPGSRTIIIDPAMAFGTGEHASTRGVMRLMQGVIRPGDIVADLGAGSAVLSIAAAKLGAARVTAIELDPDAIGNAEENVEANGVAETVDIIEGDATTLLPLLAPFRVVLANIISSVLIPLLPTIRTSITRDGQAILAGILCEERDHMVSAVDADGWTIEREDTEDVWWSVQIAPR